MRSLDDNRLARAIGRIPISVRSKLLLAFLATGILLVIVGVLGLRVIGDSNDRVVALGALQQRATVYRELETDAAQLRALLALRAGGTDLDIFAGRSPTPAAAVADLQAIDTTIMSTLQRPGRPTDLANLGFTPPPGEAKSLAEVEQRFAQLTEVMGRIVTADTQNRPSDGLTIQGREAEPIANDLLLATAQLVKDTQDQTNALISSNQGSFETSQRLFIAVAIIALALALLLGFAFSWSVVGPIRRMETRLDEISAGDFEGRVEVANRDELGSLAANINRMNDELGRLYAELETASRHKSEFLANMSHELRTPLNAIIGFSQVLREQMFGELNLKQIEYVDDVLSSGQHLLTLINDILDLAKVEAGRMELEPTTFELEPVLAGAVTVVRERATRQGVAVGLEVDPAIGQVEADERKVRQILFNLLSNAVKFTPEGGSVMLVARPVEDRIEVEVRDTGVGISPEEQARIFDEFYQVGPAKTQEGTGLGLALTKRLVELHGGTLVVASRPGAGSTFTFSLPRQQPTNGPAGAGQQAEASETRGDGRPPAGDQVPAT